MRLSDEEAVEVKKVLGLLKDGGSLRYFFLEGGVAIHGKDGAPMNPPQCCSVQVFLDLRERKLIDMTQREVTGYPYYANHHKSSVYCITKAGRKFLEK